MHMRSDLRRPRLQSSTFVAASLLSLIALLSLLLWVTYIVNPLP